MRRVTIALTAPVMLAALLAGCTVGPNYSRPPIAVPDRLYGAPADAGNAAAAASLADAPWFDVFRDPELRSLIDEALRNGYDARIAAARVEEARARFGIIESERYPGVNYDAGVTRQNVRGNGSTLVVAGVGVSWEADLWGRIRRLNESARAQFLASEEGRRAVLLSLTSEVATAYFDLRELDEELDIARRTATAFQETFDLFNRQLQGGTASAVETSRAEALLANEAATIPLLEQQLVAQENRINLLVGRIPGPIVRGAALTELPLPSPTAATGEPSTAPTGAPSTAPTGSPSMIPPGLPAALLLRRPDLRASEQQLIAANANIGVAQAAFYPTLSLTGLLGGQSSDLANIVGHGVAWSIGAGVLGPIFNGGRLRNQRRVAVAQFEEARLQYERDVTNALGEVSTALVSIDRLAASETQRQRAVAANRQSVRLVNLRYSSGLSAYFEVLDAMQQQLATENSLARVRRDRLVALVELYRALGGGWAAEPAPSPAR